MPPANVEQAMDELYGAELDDFVAERARLAKDLRDSGDREGAETVSKLRKPSVAAWALNQLARRNRREVDLLLDAGHRLREAQAGALAGADREAFDQARKAERDALSRLTHEAEKLLGERGSASAATLNQIGESLQAAAISENGRETLARGRFVQPMGAQGFEVVGELAGAAATPPRRPDRRAAAREEQKRAKQALREAKEQLRVAEHDARDAEREAERLTREAEQAQRTAGEARAEADGAARRVAEAEQRLADAGR
jgi:hypothetical protein